MRLKRVIEPVRKVEILVRNRMSQAELQKMLAAWAERQDAEVRPRGRVVRSYKTEGENLHWHIVGRRKGMGTVEVTYLPTSGRLMVLVHDNRRGFWAAQAYGDLLHEIEEGAPASKTTSSLKS
jgi:diadenosine tetraphosphate (Ap4A) HIT family hydrolase